MKIVASLALLLSVACTRPRVDGARLTRPDGSALAEDSESARAILINNCGTCHRGDLPDHKLEAVRVFDLSKEAWSSRMTPHQLRAAPTRLSATTREKALFSAFVEAEAARRTTP